MAIALCEANIIVFVSAADIQRGANCAEARCSHAAVVNALWASVGLFLIPKIF